MRKQRNFEEAIEKIARINNTKLIKEISWSLNPFVEKYRYFDTFNREYKVRVKKNRVIIKIVPVRVEKRLNLVDIEEFIVCGEKVYKVVQKKDILNHIRDFFGERGYFISFVKEKKGKISVGGGRNLTRFEENGQYGEVEIIKRLKCWQVKVRDMDKNKPYFCTVGFQYIFKIKKEVEIGESILIEYEEGEITATSLSPFAILRRAIYGFKSQNLRAFYSEDGLFPEVKHAIRLSVMGNLAGAIVNASVFVRVAERLKGNTWYTLAAGLLAFVRAPAEVYYMKKSLKLTEHLPSAKVQKVIDSERFRKIIESKEIKVWRNFERELFNLLRKKGFTNFANEYGKTKKKIMEFVEIGEKEKILQTLSGTFNFSEQEKQEIFYFVGCLVPIDVERFRKKVIYEVKKLCETNVLRENSEKIIEEYMNGIFIYNLERYTFSKSYKLLLDRIKQEERTPTREELSLLITGCKKGIIPYRIYDFLLLFSLYLIGYLATFYSGLPDIAIPFYYVFYGTSANIIVAAFTRYGSQVGMQYLYRGLDTAPTITSAADAWNEYNSHLMRIWAVFSSLGLALGILGKLLSDKTAGFSRYFVEGLAFFMYIQSLKEWTLYYNKLERRSKMEEE